MGKINGNDVLSHFLSEINKSNGTISYKCKYCSLKYTHKNVTKMKKHLNTKCHRTSSITSSFSSSCASTSTPKNLPRSTLTYGSSDCSSITSNSNNSSMEHTSTTNGTGTEMNIVDADESVGPLDIFVDRSNEKLQNDLNRKIAHAIFVTKCPLKMVEHEAWVQVFHQLKPSYEVPSRKVLSTTLLDQEYTEMRNAVNEKISAANYLTLQIDGWTDLIHRGVLNFIINTPEPVYVKYVDTKSESHTAAYIAGEILAVLNEFGPLKFTAIISDNGANMLKAADLVRIQYPYIVKTSCFAHSLNLFVRELLSSPSVARFLETVNSIIKTIKNSQVLNSEFVEICTNKKEKKRLILPAATRWNSYERCFSNMLALKTCLQLFVVQTQKLSTAQMDIKNVILSSEFWDKLEAFRALISPLVAVTVQLEGDTPNIHTVYPKFYEIRDSIGDKILHAPISAEEREVMSSKFIERQEKYMKPIYLAAYRLDPQCDTKLLTDEQEVDINEFIDKLCEDLQFSAELNSQVLADLVKYKTKSDLFSKPYIWKIIGKVSPINWWKMIPCALQEVALRILSIPATSAAIERSFSVLKDIQTRKRSSLTFERLGKLGFISFNDALMNPSSTSPKKKCKSSNFHPSESNNGRTGTNGTDFNYLIEQEEESNIDSEDSESTSISGSENDYSVHDSTDSETFSDLECEVDF